MGTLDYLSSVQAGSVTHDVKITSDGSMIVACNMNSDDITFVYPGDDTVAFVSVDPDSAYGVSTMPKYGPHGIVIDHNDSLAYVACMMKYQVRVLDLKRRRVTDSIAIPIHHAQGHLIGPTLLAISPDDRTVYVTTSGGNSLVAFDTKTKAILADIMFATPYSFGIAISDDGREVYAACVGHPLEHGRIYVIDTESLTKTDSLDVGRESFGIAWRPRR
jgi:DNA-binding beta-propeller fold protein YncE